MAKEEKVCEAKEISLGLLELLDGRDPHAGLAALNYAMAHVIHAVFGAEDVADALTHSDTQVRSVVKMLREFELH